jgi:hypothetical protein
MTFLIILLKDDAKLLRLAYKYKANSGQWSWYLARCSRKQGTRYYKVMVKTDVILGGS